MAISLKDSLAGELAAPAEKRPEPVVVPIKKKTVEVAVRDPDTAKVTLYIPRKAYKYIKQKALELDEKPHTLLMQAVDMWLMKHDGKTIASLTGPKKNASRD